MRKEHSLIELLESYLKGRRADRLREALGNEPCQPPSGWITDRDVAKGVVVPDGYVYEPALFAWRPK